MPKYDEKNTIWIPLEQNSDSYPILLIPEQIRQCFTTVIEKEEVLKHLRKEVPILNQLKHPTPPQPYYYTEQQETKITGEGAITYIYLAFIIIFFLGALAYGQAIVALIFGGMGLFLYWSFGSSALKTKKKTLKVDLSTEAYNKLLSNYEKECLEIDKKNVELSKSYKLELSKINASVSKEDIKNAENNLYYNKLKPIASFKRSTETIKRGKSEIFFLEKLINHFGAQIKADVTPELRNSYYYPDYAFICLTTGLHIDIEIDEPYSFDDKKPIHYENMDDDRNIFFIKKNWCVIRFSEKQIIEQARECIEFIENFVYAIRSKLPTFTHNLKLDGRWSYEKSLIMMNINYRNKYLTQ